MNLYVTTDEIKSFLGISDSGQDTVLAMLNKSATAQVNSILGVSDLALHKVEGEVHDGGVSVLELADMHVQEIAALTEDGDDYTQDDPYDIQDYVLHLEDGLAGSTRDVTVDYVAGWNAAGYTTLEVSTYADIVALMTITITPGGGSAVVLTEGTQWSKETDAETTAQNIADAINDHASLGLAAEGARAFVVGSTVYIVDEKPQRVTSTVALSSSAGFTLLRAAMRDVDFPENIRLAVMLYVSNLNAKRKSPKMSSYSIGGKSVQFVIDAEFQEFKTLLKPYIRIRSHIV